MPKGIPVATVALDGAANAGILAAEILGAGDKKIRDRIRDYRDKLKKEVAEKAKKV